MKKMCLLLALVVSFCFADTIEENEAAEKREFQKVVQYYTYPKAEEYYPKICVSRDRDTESCSGLGHLGAIKEYAKPIEYHQKTCDSGYAQGCFSLGRLYFEGQGVKQDPVQAKKYSDKACDLGMATACNYTYEAIWKCGGGVEIPNLSN
jgi:TPR repeat protein